MRTLIILALSLTISTLSIAQAYMAQVKPYDGKLWGYVNQNGESVIDPIYKKCYEFAENGLAPIYEGKQFIFINTNGGQFQTEISGFKLIEGFIGIGGLEGYHEGMVAVVKDKKWGFLNTQGKIAVELKYEKVSIFNSGHATAKLGNDFFIINKSGVEIKINSNEITSINRFSEGLAPFTDNNKNSGFINTDGKIAINADYIAVGYFNNGLAWVKTKDKRVGFINKKGNIVINPGFDAAKDFDPVSGLARVKIDGNWAYVNKNGEIIKVSDTEAWGDFNDGLAKGKKGGKTGYFNTEGKWVITPEFDGGRDFKNGFAAVKKGDKWGFIDKTGKWIIQPQYAAAKDMEVVTYN